MNKYLENDIKIKLGYYDNQKITQYDLETITELGINNYTLSNKNKQIDLQELRKFPNLQILTLQHFEINDKVIKILSELQKLSYIQIASCLYESNKTYNIPALKSLIINSCEFEKVSSIYAPKNFTINGIPRIVDISTIPGTDNIEKLTLSNIEKIINFSKVVEMPNLKALNLNGTKVDNQRALKILKAKIPVTQEEENLHII